MSEIQEILVSRLRFMGDVILTTPLLRVLRKSIPKARITYLAESPYHSLLENNPDVDEILFFDPRHISDQMKLLLKLIRSHFDLTIDLFGNPRSAMLTFLTGARYRIGGDFRGRKALYTHRVKNNRVSRTAVEFHLEYLKPLDVLSCEIFDPVVFVRPEEKEWAREYLEAKGFSHKKKIIGIHPGASWPSKRWLPERFVELANKLVTEMGVQIFFTLGPGDENVVRSVIEFCKFPVIKPEILTVRKLAALLSMFDLFVSNDCGPMHLAPSVGTKTVGIFGPGEPEIWFPYRKEKGHRVVHCEIECSRCHQDFCNKMDCMKAISVEDVFSVVVNSLG